ncbi:MAG: 7-cyano-7-deazaguanine synthase [Nitrospira sp.]|nr:7-cyano-7-deazaguanine synthase [Nitrospira sp.]MDH4244010.1 7-cyano-7-deazaguanine synthase [Nitrospira sp.]MDH4355882.1 7-cyano-7-deazaguanine synthase [Nitrospira sp.]MDH5317903.1 7-cyano-7-deazaguanine synthase [Nitrospira sp.]
MIKTERAPDLEPIKILWTGGWDSTFQLLQLLFVQKRNVAPIYLIDEPRPSTGMELLTMEKIRATIRRIDNEVGMLIQPTQFHFVSDIAKQPNITKAYDAICRRSFIGSQYDWLARFCEQQGISDLQLCIHEDDKAHAVVVDKVIGDTDSYNSCRMNSTHCGTDEYTVFKYFSFPVLNLTKMEMQKVSRNRGWNEIMMKTWFCYRPKRGKPCGICNPCLYTLQEGLGWRIPLSRHFLARVNQWLWYPIWHPSKQIAKRALAYVRQ